MFNSPRRAQFTKRLCNETFWQMFVFKILIHVNILLTQNFCYNVPRSWSTCCLSTNLRRPMPFPLFCWTHNLTVPARGNVSIGQFSFRFFFIFYFLFQIFTAQYSYHTICGNSFGSALEPPTISVITLWQSRIFSSDPALDEDVLTFS